jgi:ActR/RegA family two-component response regulator
MGSGAAGAEVDPGLSNTAALVTINADARLTLLTGYLDRPTAIHV